MGFAKNWLIECHNLEGDVEHYKLKLKEARKALKKHKDLMKPKKLEGGK